MQTPSRKMSPYPATIMRRDQFSFIKLKYIAKRKFFLVSLPKFSLFSSFLGGSVGLVWEEKRKKCEWESRRNEEIIGMVKYHAHTFSTNAPFRISMAWKYKIRWFGFCYAEPLPGFFFVPLFSIRSILSHKFLLLLRGGLTRLCTLVYCHFMSFCLLAASAFALRFSNFPLKSVFCVNTNPTSQVVYFFHFKLGF